MVRPRRPAVLLSCILLVFSLVANLAEDVSPVEPPARMEMAGDGGSIDFQVIESERGSAFETSYDSLVDELDWQRITSIPAPAGASGCYISDHTDIAMGVNSASKNKEDAKKFLEWLTTPEFAAIYVNALPGFFSLAKTPVKVDDDVAATMVGWRQTCKSTIRNSYQILSRGTPNLENELWNVSAQVVNAKLTPEAAAKQLQDGLDTWYKPAK